jgi:hypothetical protein
MVFPTAMTDCAVPRIDKKAMKASQTAQPTAAATNSTRFWTESDQVVSKIVGLYPHAA